ncbi:MAG: hypothetical protein AAFR58_06765 [Cyanobacteria bacterium J06627_28]
MVLTLPKRAPQTDPKRPDTDVIAVERSHTISTVRLPAGTLTSKDLVASADPSSPNPDSPNPDSPNPDSLNPDSLNLNISISPSSNLTPLVEQQPIPEEPWPAQIEQPIAPIPAAVPEIAPEVTPENSTPSQTEPTNSTPSPTQPANENNPAPTSALGSEPEYGKVMPLSAEFPDLAGSEAGCFDLEGCREMRGNLHDIEQQLIAQLEANNYQLTKRDDIEDSGRRVFEVITPDEPGTLYYLNVFSSDIGKAVYVLTVDILSLVELQQLSQ